MPEANRPTQDEKLSEELMLGSFLKPYADKGHWLNKAHGKCINCGAPAIDLYEDYAYGPIRECRPPHPRSHA